MTKNMPLQILFIMVIGLSPVVPSAQASAPAVENPAIETAAASLIQTTSENVIGASEQLSRYQIAVLRNRETLTNQVCEPLLDQGTREYCQTMHAEMNIEQAERRQIQKKAEEGSLTVPYCQQRYHPRNWTLCQAQLNEAAIVAHQQEQECYSSDVNNRITIDLTNQVMYGVKDCELIVHTKIVSGKNERETPTGTYDVYLHRTNHIMRYPALYEGEYPIDHGLYFLGAYAIHDAHWRADPYWDAEDRPWGGSNGCVNTPPEKMHELVEHFGVGDTLHITYEVNPWHQSILDRLKNGEAPYDPDPNR